MLEDEFFRTRLLYGVDAIKKLNSSKVIIFGLGGVGGYVFEALLRTGVLNIDIVDFDKINLTNINRQIIATKNTLGKFKTDAFVKRALEINEKANITPYNIFYSNETKEIDFKKYDYIVDAIDSVKSKIELIKTAKSYNVPIISSMGAGFKTDISKIKADDIYSTSYCPLARVMRNELKKIGIKNLKTVFSTEIPKKTKNDTDGIVASSIFVPAVFGLLLAKNVVDDLIK